jgi:hypothetical protein
MTRADPSRSLPRTGRVTRSGEGRSLAALGMTKRGEGLGMTLKVEGLGMTLKVEGLGMTLKVEGSG